MRASVAVRLDIRPRLRLAPDWQPRAAARRRWLPPLAVPAAGYWVAMAALTYAFAQLGPHPLDDAFASEPAPPSLLEPPSLPEPPAQLPWPEPTTEGTSQPEPAPLASALPEPDPTVEPERGAASPAPADYRASPRQPLSRAPVEQDEAITERPSFPEFTDSSRERAPERAADGPRIDSLFERSEARPSRAPAAGADREPVAPGADRDPAPVSVSSCEAAIARNDEQLEIGVRRGPADITREAYASILQHGGYLTGCSIPERTVFEICAAVKNGRAVGVTVSSSPANAPLNACVRRAVSRLKFPQSERLDVTHTRFDAALR